MTTSGQGPTSLHSQRPKFERTFAMSVVSAGNAAIAASTAFFLIVLAAPLAADQPEIALLFPLFGAFIAAFATIAILTAAWSGARHRAWFWLVASAPAPLLMGLNARHTPYAMTHPADTNPFLVTIVGNAAAVAIVIGGLAAFLEVRRRRAIWSRSGRAGWATAAISGVILGAALTSVLAGAVASSTGAGVAETPTTTGVLTVENMTFTETRLEMRDGEVVGLFVINKDGLGHSFDIDSLGVHVQLPANSTTAVAIKPSGPGEIEFYCGIPGHKAAGMVGTIVVDPSATAS